VFSDQALGGDRLDRADVHALAGRLHSHVPAVDNLPVLEEVIRERLVVLERLEEREHLLAGEVDDGTGGHGLHLAPSVSILRRSVNVCDGSGRAS
jgi:hypothetical protein